MTEPEQPPLTPLEALQELQRGFDDSGSTECQTLVDMLKDHISNEMSEHGRDLPHSSVDHFKVILKEVTMNINAMTAFLAELEKRVK